MKKITTNYYHRRIILRNIKKLRLSSGISEAYMAIKLDITQGMYSKFEAGHFQNINEYWSEIAKILNVPPLVLALPDCFSIIFENEADEVKVRKKFINENEILTKYFKLLEEKEINRIKHIRKLKTKIKELNDELFIIKNIVSITEFELNELKKQNKK